MVNFPVFFTSAVASVTRSSITPETAFFSKPVFDAKASAMALFWHCCHRLRLYAH